MIYKRCDHKGRDKDRCAHPWYASYQLDQHPRVRVSLAKWLGRNVATKSAATTAYDLLKQDVRAGVFNPNGRGIAENTGEVTTTLASLIADYERDYVLAKVQRTADDFQYRVKPLLDFFGPDAHIAGIDGPRVESLAAALRQPRRFRGAVEERPPSTASVNRPLSLLRRLLSWAEDRKLIATRPKFTFDKEDYSRWRRVNPDEETALLSAAAPRLRALIVFALDTGMRQGEMLKLRCTDIDLLAGTITPRGRTTKDAQSRNIPIGTKRLRAVLEWFMGGKGPLDPLISDETGGGISGFKTAWENCKLKAFGYTVERTRPTAGLTPQCQQALRTVDLHWHDLRHEFACRLDDRGVALGVIQRLLGHADIKTTERYLRRGAKELLAGAIKLDDGSRIDVDLPAKPTVDISAKCLKVSQLAPVSTSGITSPTAASISIH